MVESMKLKDIILFGVILVSVAGCADFLDVQPKDKQSEKQLFATRYDFCKLFTIK